MVVGLERNAWKVRSHAPAVSLETARASQDKVNVATCVGVACAVKDPSAHVRRYADMGWV